MCDHGNTKKLQSDWTCLIRGAGTTQCIALYQTLSCKRLTTRDQIEARTDHNIPVSVKHCDSIEGIGKRVPRNINHNVTSHTTGNYCIPERQLDVWHFTRLSPTGVYEAGYARLASIILRSRLLPDRY